MRREDKLVVTREDTTTTRSHSVVSDTQTRNGSVKEDTKSVGEVKSESGNTEGSTSATMIGCFAERHANVFTGYVPVWCISILTVLSSKTQLKCKINQFDKS